MAEPAAIVVPPLTDGVVALRPWRDDDVPWIVDAVQDPEIPRFTGVPPGQTADGVRRWLARVEPEREAALAIVEAASGALLGSIGLRRTADDPWIAEAGYWVAREARGRGVATRALRLLADWALPALDLARLQLTTHEENVASQRVAEAAGFRREGLLRALREQHGRRVDLLLYSRLPGDAAPE
jgi:RimJ/RimL family protein N-acetyltransferase